MKKTILILFEASGTFANIYKNAGYDVIVYDLLLGNNVLHLDKTKLPKIHGIIAHPPCTEFSKAGSRYWKLKDENGTTDKSVALVNYTLDIIEYTNPEWWFIENPVGRIMRCVPRLGQPIYSFHPWFFGHPYYKQTLLWGSFNNSLELCPVFPGFGDYVAKNSGSSAKAKFAKSRTFDGFARSFFKANP